MTLINLAILFSKPTGIATYAANLFPYLKPIEPTLLISNSAAEIWQAAKNYPCYSIPGNMTPAQGSKGHLRRLIWTQQQLPQIAKKLESRLLFSPIPEAPLYANCRFVVMVHDLIPLRFPRRFSPLTTYFRYYIPQVLQQAEQIICNSEATAKDIVNFWGISLDKITSIPLAYDASRFRPLDLNKVDSDSKKRYFLYLGRHDPYKNLHRVIEAFASVDCECELWLAGSTDKRYTPKLIIQAEELGVGDRVKFLDYVSSEQLPIIINQAISLVFPSLWEGFGLPVLEAMACGTPVITSNLSALPEVAVDAGILVNPYDTREIAAAMQEIAKDDNLRSQLSHLSLQRASQFSWAKTGQATVEILRGIGD